MENNTEFKRAKLTITIITDGSSGYIASIFLALWRITTYLIDPDLDLTKRFRLTKFDNNLSSCKYISLKVTEL